MSFWDLSDGESATDTGKEFDGGGGNMAPIPEGASVMAMPDEAKWAEDRQNNEYLSIRWRVMKPEAYANRVIFQKLWISDDDPRAKDPAKKRDKAKRMFAAIDANAGGRLGKKGTKPTDDELGIALVSKPMVLKLGIWEMEADDGKPMAGNWVIAVSPKDKPLSLGEEKAAPARNAGNGGGGRRMNNSNPFESDLDDDIPFISNGAPF